MPYINLRQSPKLQMNPDTEPAHPGPHDISAEIKPHLVFLIRKNSATVGGIQTHNARLYGALSPNFDIEKISWNGPEWGVPFYFPLFYYKATRNGAGLVYCDDAVTSLIGSRIRAGSGKIVVATAHGLDVILPIPWYQKELGKAFAAMDRIFCVSRATAERVKERGGRPDRIEVIPGAVEKNPIRFPRNDELFQNIGNLLGTDLRGKRILISVGRSVRRKGFDRFISEVFCHLSEDYIYIAISPKPMTPSWIKALRPLLRPGLYQNLLLASGAYSMHDDLVRQSSHNSRVFYLNNVSAHQRNMFLSAADLFIMPNRTVEGDMEGFGLVALEAASRGLPVIATGIEGITDAVIDGQNGYCIAENDTRGFIDTITGLMADPHRLQELSRRAAEFTCSNFSQERIFGRYAKAFEMLLSSNGRPA